MRNIPSLACPACHGMLTLESESRLLCGPCGKRYPIIDEIPSFLSPVAGEAASSSLTVVIPALNESTNLGQLLPSLNRTLQSLEIVHELIVVDGGSRDATAEVARAHGADVITQTEPGYGGALRAGFERARGRFIITLDADGSHDPSLISELWAGRSSAEVLIGSRYIRGGGAEMSALRYMLSRILNVTYRRGLSLPVADLSSGYRLYTREAIEAVTLTATDFDILEEILIKTLAAGYRVREIPMRYRTRVDGRTHVRLFQFGLSYVRTFLAMWKLRNSIASADYDSRAYDSIIPLQRSWQRRRFHIITRQAAGARRILDVGCGSSRILSFQPSIVGLDVQLNKLRYARRFGNPLVHGTIFALPFADASFDCVICSEVIEHIPAERRVFDELWRVMAPGGRLILGTPDYDRRSWRVLEWLYARVAPGGYADEHITHYGRVSLETYLRGLGFEIQAIEYVFGSELILTVRRPPDAVGPPAPVPPVTTALTSR